MTAAAPSRLWSAVQSRLKALIHKASRTAQLVHCLIDNRMLWEKSSRCEIAILLRGGVGDAVIAARWLHQVLPLLAAKADMVVDLYYAIPSNIDFIYGQFPNIRYLYNGIAFDHVRKYYDFSFVINHLGCLDMDTTSLDGLPFTDILEAWRPGVERFAPFTTSDYHPDLGQDLAGLIQDGGFQRHTILEAQTGLPAPLAPFPFKLPSLNGLASHPVLKAPYLTIHDGWDAQLRISDYRPTKALPAEAWETIVAAIKVQFPGLGVVQLGGGAGVHVPGVDLDLKGVIGLAEAARVLQGARLHIDTDSGLTHLAASLGVRSVVMFGPTSRDYYGYAQNINLNSGACAPCWLKVGNWVDRCMLGDREPRCMTGFSVGQVVDAIRESLAAVSLSSTPGLTQDR